MRATQLLLFGAVLATLAATCAASPTAGRRDAKADLATSPMAPEIQYGLLAVLGLGIVTFVSALAWRCCRRACPPAAESTQEHTPGGVVSALVAERLLLVAENLLAYISTADKNCVMATFAVPEPAGATASCNQAPKQECKNTSQGPYAEALRKAQDLADPSPVFDTSPTRIEPRPTPAAAALKNISQSSHPDKGVSSKFVFESPDTASARTVKEIHQTANLHQGVTSRFVLSGPCDCAAAGCACNKESAP